MATSKKRASGLATLSKAAIEQVGLKLKDLPEKPKENLSLREAISELHDSITTALNRGYSYDEIAKILATQGVSVTVASLKRYLAAARKEMAEKPKRTRRITPASRQTQLEKQAEARSTAATPTNTLNGSTVPTVPPVESKKQTRTTSTRSKTAAQLTAARTKTAAKAKPTSSAKTTSRSTSRSTSSRSRRQAGASE